MFNTGMASAPRGPQTAATKQTSGRIDISILTTGLSATGRKRLRKVAAAPRKIIKERGSAPTVAYIKPYHKIRVQSNIMITQEMFEDDIQDPQDDVVMMVAGR